MSLNTPVNHSERSPYDDENNKMTQGNYGRYVESFEFEDNNDDDNYGSLAWANGGQKPFEMSHTSARQKPVENFQFQGTANSQTTFSTPNNDQPHAPNSFNSSPKTKPQNSSFREEKSSLMTRLSKGIAYCFEPIM